MFQIIDGRCRITERNVFEFERFRRFHLHRIRHVFNVWLDVQRFVDAVERSAAALHNVDQLADRKHRPDHHPQVHVEGHEIAQG
ncbi:TilS substrate-binding domain-containing protein [Paenibacillus macerans]|uniref:TilS substrate-binding domain-containing protein n=1 Tax=Paenibacillus macerans TaxID=44252 RepID=UPI0037CB59CC